MGSNYYFDKKTFVIKDYDKVKPFASFLPGIAGKKGIPLWCYYVNRGQGVASFGLRDKDGAILEFSPANTSYRIVDKLGFRTFIKEKGLVYEIFSPNDLSQERTMYIENSNFSIEEINKDLNIKVKVTYFGLPNENIGGLVRMVSIKSLTDEVREIEVVDGLTEIIPSGVGEWSMKHQSNLTKSWMDVDLLANNIAFYKTNSAPGDEAEVKVIYSGNYYFSQLDGKTIKPIYDANIIFGNDTTLSVPLNFKKYSVTELCEMPQYPINKVPVGFSAFKIVLDKEYTLNTIIGFSYNKEMIINKIYEMLDSNYFCKKLKEATDEIDFLIKDVYTKTNYPIFDAYMQQNYLDNILRGGYPVIIDANNNKFVYYLYSRRHGDLEREYNFFSIAPEFYSQGNGNFRDVCQNRRSDNLFCNDVEMYNAKVFASLIQLDGYNPLGVLGSMFHLKDKKEAINLSKLFDNKNDVMKQVLEGRFTPGIIMNTMESNKITSSYSDEELFNKIFAQSIQEINAEFLEGYWSDHWTYIFDLIENALNVYPEKINEYLFDDITYGYFESPATVLPRSEKYYLTKNNKVRQYGAIIESDIEKIEKLGLVSNFSNWSKDKEGNTLQTNLYGKLLLLSTMKFASLDAIGVGIEMEANKPGWNDAMNGLPGLFGSGISETIELARIVKFLTSVSFDGETYIPIELYDLINEISEIYDKETDTFKIWDLVNNAKELYRSKCRFGTNGLISIKVSKVKNFVNLMKKVLDRALEKALDIGNGIYPTFIVFEATRYELTNHIGNYKLPNVRVKEFKYRPLPYFLEAPARAYKYIENDKVKKEMYERIKNSELRDSKYKMYKTSVSLDSENYEIGRIRAFQSGWLERESNFLHMTYKYLLGLLKGKLYQEFFEEIRTNFVCFMDPSIYGRSTLENSSFIAPSNNPDPLVQGQGFVARLSGSTAEMLSIWQVMMFGYQPYIFSDELRFELKPILSKDFFNKENIVEALYANKTLVTYINQQNKDLFNVNPYKYELITDNEVIETKEVIGALAQRVRKGDFKQIKVYFD